MYNLPILYGHHFFFHYFLVTFFLRWSISMVLWCDNWIFKNVLIFYVFNVNYEEVFHISFPYTKILWYFHLIHLLFIKQWNKTKYIFKMHCQKEKKRKLMWHSSVIPWICSRGQKCSIVCTAVHLQLIWDLWQSSTHFFL